jgi:hypothetical protein
MKRKRGGDESVSSESTPAHGNAAGASIAGVLRGSGGEPVAGAMVSLSSDVGSRDVAQETAADGTFRFGGLALGEYVVHIGGEAKKKVRVREEREYEVTLTERRRPAG